MVIRCRRYRVFALVGRHYLESKTLFRRLFLFHLAQPHLL